MKYKKKKVYEFLIDMTKSSSTKFLFHKRTSNRRFTKTGLVLIQVALLFFLEFIFKNKFLLKLLEKIFFETKNIIKNFSNAFFKVNERFEIKLLQIH